MIDEGSEDKEKVKKKCAIKRKLKFENYKNCLEATQLDDKIYYLGKNEFNVISLKKDRKEFIKNRKLLLKTQQRFTNERHNVFTKEINKIALSLNHDKRIQSIDLIETYAYGTSKVLVSEKGEIICDNETKRYK